MSRFLLMLLLGAGLAIGVGAGPAAALTVVECVDAEGNRSFRDKCPPGMEKKGEKTLRGVSSSDDPSLEDVATANPITLYTVPNCDACDLVRNALSSRGLPFSEKDVQDNAELQEELKAETGGLTVPATKIGSRQALTGYSRSALDIALEQAGYPVVPDTAAAAGDSAQTVAP